MFQFEQIESINQIAPGQLLIWSIIVLDVVLGLLIFNAVKKRAKGKLGLNLLATILLIAVPLCVVRLRHLLQPGEGELAGAAEIFTDIFFLVIGQFIAVGYILLVLVNWLLSKRRSTGGI